MTAQSAGAGEEGEGRRRKEGEEGRRGEGE